MFVISRKNDQNEVESYSFKFDDFFKQRHMSIDENIPIATFSTQIEADAVIVANKLTNCYIEPLPDRFFANYEIYQVKQAFYKKYSTQFQEAAGEFNSDLNCWIIHFYNEMTEANISAYLNKDNILCVK